MTGWLALVLQASALAFATSFEVSTVAAPLAHALPTSAEPWSLASVTGLMVIALGSAESLHQAVETLLHAWS